MSDEELTLFFGFYFRSYFPLSITIFLFLTKGTRRIFISIGAKKSV